MNVDREDELRIQAPPGAASASERWLQLDGTGMMPEAQERKRSTTAHTNSLKRNLKEKILRRRSAARGRSAAGMSWREEKESLLCECVRVRVCGESLPAGSQPEPLFGKCQMPSPVPAFQSQASPCRPNLRRSGANPRKPPRFGPLITSLHSGSTDTNLSLIHI